MSDPFHSSKYCIDHAERRISELIGEVNAFNKTNPYERAEEVDPDTGENVYKIKLVKPVPVALNGIIFDVVNNLRAALDHAGYAAATAGARTKGRDAHFPFGMTINEVKGRAKRRGRSKDIPKEIFDVMVSCKPHKGGNDLLWALNELCNTNKHEIIIPIPTGVGGYGVNITGSGQVVIASPKWDRTKNELEYARTGKGGKFRGDFQFSFFVAIGHVDVIDGKPAVGVMERMLHEVKRILMAIEAEAARIGLFK